MVPIQKETIRHHGAVSSDGGLPPSTVVGAQTTPGGNAAKAANKSTFIFSGDIEDLPGLCQELYFD